MNTAAAALRRLMTDPQLVRLPGIFDGISAHLARRAGFRAAYATGAGIAASGFGLPDIGLVTATEMVERIGTLVRASELPLLADMDTGYGNALHVTRTVKAYEAAGVAGLHLEDQDFPKRCGHLADKHIIDADDYRRKLAAALAARAGGSDGLVVVARTDARGPLGMPEALARARAYAVEGPDALFIEAPQSMAEVEQIGELGRSVGIPVLFNVVPNGRSPVVTEGRLAELGFAATLEPGMLLSPTAEAMTAAAMCAAGAPAPRTPAIGPRELFDTVGLREWADLDATYGRRPAPAD